MEHDDTDSFQSVVQKVRHYIEKQTEGHGYIIIGQGLGANVALEIGLQTPPDMRGCVFIAPENKPPNPMVVSLCKKFKELISQQNHNLANDLVSDVFLNLKGNDRSLDIIQTNVSAMGTLFDLSLSKKVWNQEEMNKFRIPNLVSISDSLQFVSYENSRKFAEDIGTNQGCVELIGCTSIPSIQCPERLGLAIEEFANQLSMLEVVDSTL